MHAIPRDRQTVIDRFVAACQADERVAAAFLGGSFAKGTADAYSDLDFGVITTDEAYEDFFADRVAFMQRLGETVFVEVFSDYGFDIVSFIFSDGVEGEVVLGRQSRFTHIHMGPYHVLLDKQGILTGAVFPRPEVAQAEQIETLRGLLSWFWHDLSHHVLTPLARGQLWSAYAGLQDLRLGCVNLARLTEDFSAVPEGYERVEQALPIERLVPLEATCCPLDRDRILQAARDMVSYYETLAPPLAHTHALPYPTELARIMVDRLERLSEA